MKRLAVLLFIGICVFGCDDMQKPIMDVVEDVVEPTVDPTYTYIGFRPSENMLTPINPADEWDGWNDTIWQKTVDGLYYSKHLLIDDWEIRADALTGDYLSEFEHWIYAVSSSKIVYDISEGDYSKFDGYVGLRWHGAGCGHGGTVEFIFAIDGIGVWKSGRLAGVRETGPIHVSFDIPADAQTLTVVVTDAGDGIGCDHWIMGDAHLTHRIVSGIPEPTVELTVEPIPDPTVDPTYTYVGFRPSENMLIPINPADEWDGWNDTIWQKTIDGLYYSKHLLLDDWELRADLLDIVHDLKFEHWIYAHAPSKIVYDLSGDDYSKFDGYVGLRWDTDGCGHGGTVEFHFAIDDIGVWQSGKLAGIRDTEPVHVAFDVPVDAQTLTIIVTNAGDGRNCDHWVMGNAHLTYRQFGLGLANSQP